MFAFALSASAVSVLPFYDAIFDGQTEVTDHPGERINVEFLAEVDSGEVLHAFSTDLIGDGVPRECHDVSNVQGEQDRLFDLDHTLPQNTGDYGFRIVAFTADNPSQANAYSGSTACTGDSTVIYDEGDVVHVIPSGSSNGGTGSTGDSDTDGLWSAVNALKALIESLTATVTEIVSNPAPAGPQCPPAYYGSNRIEVQSWLMGNGYASGFNAVGVYSPSQPGVIWGPVSQSAYSQALDACS